MTVLGLTAAVVSLTACQPTGYMKWIPYLEASADTDRGIHARFFGTTTLVIDDGKTAMLVDGFFSRPDLIQVGLGKLSPDEVAIDEALRAVGEQRIDLLLVAHSHYDHAMDVPVVAARTGARLVGSQSTLNVARGCGLPEEQLEAVGHGTVLTSGQFTVTVIQAPHSPGNRYTGTIDVPLDTPARVGAYKACGSFSFLIEHELGTILVWPSANRPFAPLSVTGVDVVLLGIGGLSRQSQEFAKCYWQEVVEATGAQLVIPIHWDNFFSALADPLPAMPTVFDDVTKSMRQLVEFAADSPARVRLLRPVERVRLTPVVVDSSESKDGRDRTPSVACRPARSVAAGSSANRS